MKFLKVEYSFRKFLKEFIAFCPVAHTWVIFIPNVGANGPEAVTYSQKNAN